MLITRLDAFHPAGDGVFCTLWLSKQGPARYVDRLLATGWEVDVYEEEVGPLSDAQWQFLVGGYWPLVPTSTLLEWFPKVPAADVDGEEVFEPQGIAPRHEGTEKRSS